MRAHLALVVPFLLAGCHVGTSQTFAPERLERERGWTAVRGVPFVEQQREMDCGAAAAAMVLAFWRHPAAEQAIWQAARPRAGHGLSAGWLRNYLRRSGLTAYLVHGAIDDVAQELARGSPVLVGVMKASGKTGLTHYQVVVAMSTGKATIVVLDPATGWRESRVDDFEKEWARTKHVMIVAHARSGEVAAR
jgi:ABC-type bacteriocin/lantibiotic exporter with double-glycine peptidase domain